MIRTKQSSLPKLILNPQSPTLPIKSPLGSLKHVSKQSNQKSLIKNLSFLIQKYKLLYKSNQPSLIYCLLEVISQFGLVENNFKQVFLMIYHDLRRFLLFRVKDTKDQLLKNKYSLKEGDLWRNLFYSLQNRIQNDNKILNIQLKSLKDQNIQLTQQLIKLKQASHVKQQILQQQIERLIKLSNTDYTKHLQKMIQQQKQRINQLQQSQKKLLQHRQDLQKQVIEQKQIINNQLIQIQQISTILKRLRIGKDQSQVMLLKLRDRFDQLSLKTITIRNMIANVQSENQSLKTQRVKLTKRAAVAFQQLTPRPKYQKIFNLNQKQQMKPLKSTIQITQLLLSQLKDPVKSMIKPLIFAISQPHHPSLTQAQKNLTSTLAILTKSKSQLKQTLTFLNNIQQ